VSKRSPGRNKRKWLRDRLEHVRKRARERYGLSITDEDIRVLHERLDSFLSKCPPAKPVRVYIASAPTTERPYVIYAVALQEVWLPVIYERERGVIHTILPPDVLPERSRELDHSR